MQCVHKGEGGFGNHYNLNNDARQNGYQSMKPKNAVIISTQITTKFQVSETEGFYNKEHRQRHTIGRNEA